MLQTRSPHSHRVPNEDESWPCQQCEHIAPTRHALHIHSGLHHPDALYWRGHYLRSIAASCAADCGGMRSARCGSSFTQQPHAEVEMKPAPAEQTAPPTAAEAMPQNTPLVLRPVFQTAWKSLGGTCRLTSRCQMSIADIKHIKKHLRRLRTQVVDDLHELVITRWLPFTSHLVSNSLHQRCGYKIWVPGRHVTMPCLVPIMLGCSSL